MWLTQEKLNKPDSSVSLGNPDSKPLLCPQGPAHVPFVTSLSLQPHPGVQGSASCRAPHPDALAFPPVYTRGPQRRPPCLPCGGGATLRPTCGHLPIAGRPSARPVVTSFSSVCVRCPLLPSVCTGKELSQAVGLGGHGLCLVCPPRLWRCCTTVSPALSPTGNLPSSSCLRWCWRNLFPSACFWDVPTSPVRAARGRSWCLPLCSVVDLHNHPFR